MQKDVILTPEGLQNLKEELEHLQGAKRREVAERIKEAREFAAISENSEYDAAKNEQPQLESRIAQLEHLQGAKRREVAERIKEAREFGDISENSEYDDAKNEQAQLESRIAQLEERLRGARVLDADELGTDVVRVGSKVDVTDEKNKK